MGLADPVKDGGGDVAFGAFAVAHEVFGRRGRLAVSLVL